MTPLQLIVFPGAPNLPIYAGRELGSFARHGLELELETTPSSMVLAEELVSGRFQIAGSAFDNIVAYQAGQGEVELSRPPDFFAFMGASRIELTLMARPGIESVAALKGESLAMDALTTGFAFVLYAMLEDAGLALDDCRWVSVGSTPARWQALRDGAHAATLLIEPFASLARAQGFHALCTSRETLAHYQGGVFAAGRAWAAEHPTLLSGFIRGYLEALAWCLAPANVRRAGEILRWNMPAIGEAQLAAVMQNLLSPATGLTPEGRIGAQDVETVLELRRRYGPDASAIQGADAYIDLGYLRAARGR